MPITADELIEHTYSLLNSASNEAEYRNVVSKGYYGMYHSVLSILDNAPPSVIGQGVHASLISYLKSHDVRHSERHPHRSLRALATVLAAYKEKRVIADYTLEATVDKEHAEDMAKAATRLKQKCDGLLASLDQ